MLDSSEPVPEESPSRRTEQIIDRPVIYRFCHENPRFNHLSAPRDAMMQVSICSSQLLAGKIHPMGTPRDVARADRTRRVRTLLARLSKDLADQIRTAVSDIDLTETQAAVLRELETPLTQRQIADALSCEPSNVTFVIDKLENRELVARTPHPRDRRVNVVELTDAGRKARTETIERFESSSPLAGLSDRELDQLEALLTKATGTTPA